MKRKSYILTSLECRACFILFFLGPVTFQLFAQNPALTSAQYKEDFNFFWNTVNDEYCYFNKKQTDWNKVKEIYGPLIDTVHSRNGFVTILEKALYEIYDHHAILNTNTQTSQHLVPAGADLWAEYVDGRPMITATRNGFDAESVGIRPGMEVIAVNNLPVETVVNKFLPRSLKSVDNEARSFALRLALAGNHLEPRIIKLRFNNITRDYFPDKTQMRLEHISYAGKIESKRYGKNGYIRINDCLYDNDLIAVFDSVMEQFRNTSGLILDLRETPSGGNTSVARAIIGWFIDSDHFYQKHEYFAEEKATGIKRSWEEIVSARKGKYYNKPLVILCGRWTGSIAEGIVIAFDALKRPGTTIAGTELARLNGAVYTFEMPNSKIRFTFPAERLYHINGMAREKYVPPVYIDWRKQKPVPGEGELINKALQILKSTNTR